MCFSENHRLISSLIFQFLPGKLCFFANFRVSLAPSARKTDTLKPHPRRAASTMANIQVWMVARFEDLHRNRLRKTLRCEIVRPKFFKRVNNACITSLGSKNFLKVFLDSGGDVHYLPISYMDRCFTAFLFQARHPRHPRHRNCKTCLQASRNQRDVVWDVSFHEVIIFHCYSKCMVYACVKWFKRST